MKNVSSKNLSTELEFSKSFHQKIFLPKEITFFNFLNKAFTEKYKNIFYKFIKNYIK
jgi:hypothetical protein